MPRLARKAMAVLAGRTISSTRVLLRHQQAPAAAVLAVESWLAMAMAARALTSSTMLTPRLKLPLRLLHPARVVAMAKEVLATAMAAATAREVVMEATPATISARLQRQPLPVPDLLLVAVAA